MDRRRKSLPLLLALGLIFVASACGGGDDQGAGNAEPVRDAGPDTPEDDAPEPDALADADAPGDEPDAPGVEPVVVPLFDAARITSDQGAENFQAVRTDLDIPQGPWAEARLVVELTSTCYPFDKWADNPPPQGHNWPEDCDAFDRNFEFVLDDPQEAGEPPGIELVRAITPFGGPMVFEADVTDLANVAPGTHRLRAHITTWGDGAGQVSGARGGWNVSARLVLTPGAAPRRVLAVLPLFDGSVGADNAPGPLRFTLPEGTTSARLEYRVTGHGGATDRSCIGPAEEFCERTHRVTADGRLLGAVVPWREDCDQLCTLTTYEGFARPIEHCLENPCGAIGSVRAPRANWCPGSVTPPLTWEPEAWTSPGEHELAFTIFGVKPGGSWRVSATVYAFGE